MEMHHWEGGREEETGAEEEEITGRGREGGSEGKKDKIKFSVPLVLIE